tara:strand:+ start:1312 stop:1611 length:300 start_codon:yes stop_codon:yes gene_type:complete
MGKTLTALALSSLLLPIPLGNSLAEEKKYLEHPSTIKRIIKEKITSDGHLYIVRQGKNGKETCFFPKGKFQKIEYGDSSRRSIVYSFIDVEKCIGGNRK